MRDEFQGRPIEVPPSPHRYPPDIFSWRENRSKPVPDGVGLLSVDVEDWFHSENLSSSISRDDWDSLELRVEANTMRVLEVFEEHGVRATFFVLGWVAARLPHLVRAIAAGNHEIASHGYNHQLLYRLTPEKFRDDFLKSRKLLEDIVGAPVRGYRAPCFSITDWALNVLEEEGVLYDSSVVLAFTHDRYGRVPARNIRQPVAKLGPNFFEVGVSCLFGEKGIPWGGGGYFRLTPFFIWRLGVEHVLRSDFPYVFYFHPWEIDADHPIPAGTGRINRFRQSVNLRRCQTKIHQLLDICNWMTIGQFVDGMQSRNDLETRPL